VVFDGGGAVNLELVMPDQGCKISYNRIQRVLKMCGLAKNKPKKQKKRKWVRRERKHSNQAATHEPRKSKRNHHTPTQAFKQKRRKK
jgi:hypothetical protein